MVFNKVIVGDKTFELVGSAGHGRFGTAFLYQDESGGKLICKLISPISGTDDITHLIKREITILQTLIHPNIVRYISSEFGPSHGQQARICMEYCEGGDLSRVDKALFTPEFVWKVFFQLALALAYCHHGLKVIGSTGGVQKFEVEERWTTILHRDIKPSNVLLWNSDSEVVKLCDFGIGKVIRSEMSGTYTGTSAFRPPEITREKPHWTTKSDIYSLGCTMLYLISRTLPPNSRRQRLSGNALLRAIRTEAPSFEDIFMIIERCLDTTVGRNGRERPSSLTLLKLTGPHASQSAPENSPCSVKGWENCFNYLFELSGKFNRESFDEDHEDELVLRLCFLIRDGGEEQLLAMRERLLRSAQMGTILSKRLRRAISILDAEAKFDEIVRLAETLTSTMPPIQKDGLLNQLLLLMKDGGDKVTKGEAKETPLHRSTRRGEVDQISVLLHAGANINAIMLKGRTALQLAADLGFQHVAKFLLSNGADINGRDGNGNTALHLAAKNGHDKMIPLLLEKGADINGKNEDGDTGLHLAARDGHEKVMLCLLEREAAVGGGNRTGDTALHLAARNGYRGAVQILLESGAGVKAKNSVGDTARDIAAKEGYQEIAELLDRWLLLG